MSYLNEDALFDAAGKASDAGVPDPTSARGAENEGR